MSTVFTDEQTVFFVGGRGDGSGAIADAGGCIKDWWDSEVAANGVASAMAKLMSSTGGPIINMGTADYTTADERITKAGIGVGVEVGMIAYVIKDGGVGSVFTGRYEITAVDPGWVECLGIQGTDCTVTIVIGGAFDTLSNATDETSATTHSVWIHTNLAETLAGALTLTAGGNNVRNTFKRILGFNTLPGDMDRGGAYYESPFDILLNGSIDNNKTVLLDANNGAFEPLSISADNVIIENLHLYNTNNENGIIFVGTPQNIVLRNLRFSAVKSAHFSAADSVLTDSCYTHGDLTDFVYVLLGNDNVMLNCVSDVPANKDFAVYSAVSGGQVIGCLALNGKVGVRAANMTGCLTIMNNTFYDQTQRGISVVNSKAVIVLNNIFALASGVSAVGMQITTAGVLFYNDYNCFIESDGTPLTVGDHASGYEVPVIGPHSITMDPMFVDAANGNFRLQESSPVFNAGIRGVLGGYSTIGGFGPYHNIKNAAYKGDTNVIYGGDNSIYDR